MLVPNPQFPEMLNLGKEHSLLKAIENRRLENDIYYQGRITVTNTVPTDFSSRSFCGLKFCNLY